MGGIMNKKYTTTLLLILFLLTFIANTRLSAKRKPIVVPTHNSYVLVHGAHLWPVHGYYSLHPAVMPEIISTIVCLPAWNGVFWAYKYTVIPKY